MLTPPGRVADYLLIVLLTQITSPSHSPKFDIWSCLSHMKEQLMDGNCL